MLGVPENFVIEIVIAVRRNGDAGYLPTGLLQRTAERPLSSR